MIGQRSVDAQSKITLDGTKLEDNTHVHVEPISSGFSTKLSMDCSMPSILLFISPLENVRLNNCAKFS
ncbi:UNVERIFIED_CONTAM: hypothetical protein NCL1_14601 [Trichonephila clavipes]